MACCGSSDDSPFASVVEIGKEIAKGSTGTVYHCVDKRDKGVFAVKLIPTPTERDRIKESLSEEAKVCMLLDRHLNIARMYGDFVELDHHYMVFELVKGGDLFGDICNREYFSEIEAKEYIKQILGAVKHCHRLNIVHRDLEPSNILFDKRKRLIKLVDFGSAKSALADETSLTGYVGSPMYMAPEMLNGKPYGKPIDMWACGVIFYTLLTGLYPYPPPYTFTAIKRIQRRNRLNFLSTDFDGVSREAVELTKCLMHFEQENRTTARNALRHPYMSVDAHTSHRQKTLDNLRSFYSNVWGAFDSRRYKDSSYFDEDKGDHNTMRDESSTITQSGDWLTFEITETPSVSGIDGAKGGAESPQVADENRTLQQADREDMQRKFGACTITAPPENMVEERYTGPDEPIKYLKKE